MKSILTLLSVLKAGNEFSNSAAWKSVQFWVSIITSLFGAIGVFGYTLSFTDEEVTGFVVVIAGLLNAFITVGSSSKIGVK